MNVDFFVGVILGFIITELAIYFYFRLIRRKKTQRKGQNFLCFIWPSFCYMTIWPCPLKMAIYCQGERGKNLERNLRARKRLLLNCSYVFHESCLYLISCYLQSPQQVPILNICLIVVVCNLPMLPANTTLKFSLLALRTFERPQKDYSKY